MRLRWFVTCDKFGIKTEPTLQYWDEDCQEWVYVPYVECKDWEEYKYTKDKEAV